MIITQMTLSCPDRAAFIIIKDKKTKKEKNEMKILKMIRHDSELRKNMLVIILILAGIRLFYSVPVPGININYFADILKANSALGFMNVLTGNGLSNMSVMMLNITPFITASIIMQLMGNIFPRLQEMQKGLKTEQKKYENITIVLGIIFAFAESCAIAIGYGANGLFKEFTWYWAVSAIAAWTIGSAAASLLGKHIQEKYGRETAVEIWKKYCKRKYN